MHIVWNDNPARPYKPDTIAGDFGNVLLIIQPLTHLNLYSVHIRTDDGSPSATTTTTSTTRRPFGPLLRDCVVPRATLGELVRWTAVHAHRAVTAGELQHHPYGYRAQDVRMMTQRHRSEQSYAEVVEQVLDVRVSSTTTVASAVASAVAVPSPSAV